MSIVTKIIENVVSANSGEVIGSASAGIGGFFGRIVKDWSICTVCVLGISGVTTGIIGALTASPIAIAISVAVFVAALFLGIFRMVQIMPEKDLDGQIKDLEKGITDVDQENKVLEQNIVSLKETKEDLKKANEEAKAANAELEKILAEKTLNLEKTTKELTDTVEKLDILEKIHSQFTVSVQSLASDISKMSFNNGELKLATAKLGEFLKEFQQNNQIFAFKISKFHDMNEYYQKQNDRLKGLKKCDKIT